MPDINAFTPYSNNTVNLTATTSSGNVALPTRSSIGGNETVDVYNSGLVDVFIEFGTTSAITASTATSMPIPPGVKTLGCPSSITYIAGITASGSATVYFSLGKGI